MEPGYGAEVQASRRARRLAEKRRAAEAAGATNAQVVAALEAEQRRLRAWSAGAEGERLVAAALDALLPYGWTALHDMHWPDRPQANVDHIAIGPGGVVVIDAKNWSGDVRLSDGVLRQNGYRRDRELDAVAAMTSDIAVLLAPHHRTAVVGTICLAAQDQPYTRTANGVGVVGRLELATTLAAMPARLSPYDVADIGRFLAGRLGAPQRASRAGRRQPGPTPPARRQVAAYQLPPTPTRPPRPPRPPRSASSRRRPRRRSALGGLVRLAVTLLVAWGFVQWVSTLQQTVGS